MDPFGGGKIASFNFENKSNLKNEAFCVTLASAGLGAREGGGTQQVCQEILRRNPFNFHNGSNLRQIKQHNLKSQSHAHKTKESQVTISGR